MTNLRRALAIIILGVAAVGCTDSGGPSTTGSPPTSTEPTQTSAAPTKITPGEFQWINAGLDVSLTLKTNTGSMSVDNGSDHALGRPDIYVIDGTTGKQIDGKVLDSKPIAEGAKATFSVQFPPEVNDKELGLVILLFGSDNYGAFAPA
jgi:hypothetical protein